MGVAVFWAAGASQPISGRLAFASWQRAAHSVVPPVCRCLLTGRPSCLGPAPARARYAKRGSKHRRRRKDGGGSRRHGKKSKEGKGKGRRRERKESKDKGGKKSVEQLRLERLQREEGERQRQQRVMAVAAGRDPALLGKKYYGGYGFGKR